MHPGMKLTPTRKSNGLFYRAVYIANRPAFAPPSRSDVPIRKFSRREKYIITFQFSTVSFLQNSGIN